MLSQREVGPLEKRRKFPVLESIGGSELTLTGKRNSLSPVQS